MPPHTIFSDYLFYYILHWFGLASYNLYWQVVIKQKVIYKHLCSLVCYSVQVKSLHFLTSFPYTDTAIVGYLECLSATDWLAQASGFILYVNPDDSAYPVNILQNLLVPLPASADDISKCNSI